ncbi:unnamed protein product [Psylliodes chrysocephalus]|uniref:SWIM-type domain-containing protein n=1 Tax=Psylliodes chrysocephalus TaxID=3402493 RepID=A0A9P0CY14_9CUCU|nr:unnamed protein product [Psylliodes chrysocephala]
MEFSLFLKNDPNMDIAICECFMGSDGRLCKHQIAVEKFMGVTNRNILPINDPHKKQHLYYIATGKKMDLTFFFSLRDKDHKMDDQKSESGTNLDLDISLVESDDDDNNKIEVNMSLIDLPKEEEINNTELELEKIFKDLAEKLKSKSDLYLPAIQKFTSKYKTFNSDSNIVSSLHNFGSTLNVPNYTQKYRGEWEKLPEMKGWLQPCTTDYTKAYCKYCKCFINARLGDIKKHNISLKHKAAEKPFSCPRQQKLNFEPNNKGVTTQQRKEGDICLFVAAHTSINAIDHLCEINNVPVHRTKCTNLIKNVVGPHFMKDLLFDVGANPYSLIIDESTDVAVLKMLGIVIRYFSTKHSKIVIQATNKSFEASNADVTKLFNNLNHLYLSIIKKIVIPNANIHISSRVDDFENHLDPNPYLGYAFENSCRDCHLDQDSKEMIKGRCISFLIELAKQLRQRLPENIKILNKMQYFSVTECLKPNKIPITDIATQFYDDAQIVSKIENEWASLHLINWAETQSTEQFWIEVNNYRDASNENPFQNLVNLALRILCLPHSNADVERVFSSVSIVKNKIRNRMKLNLLNNILSIKFGMKRMGKCCNTYKLPDEILIMSFDSNAAYKNNDDEADQGMQVEIDNILQSLTN